MRRFLVAVGCWLSLAGVSWSADRIRAPATDPISTDDREFAIPFLVEPFDAQGEPLAWVQLHVSEDHGRSWRLEEEARPEKGSFTFRAPRDGEYWFLVRSIDRQGHAWPEASTEPELRVVVGHIRPEEKVHANFSLDQLPPGVRPRMVNTPAFELEYDIDGREAGSVKRVELWWTGDGGKTWKPFGVDADCRSPMLVSVDHEGLYGFWMAIEDATGAQGATPRDGDTPQVWIGVDTSSPEAKLLTAETTHSAKGDHLTVRWEALDEFLPSNPISLAYGASPSGPWITLAAARENNGVYTCGVTDRWPSSVFLRLEARDEAGNIKTVISSDPIAISRTDTASRPTRGTSETARSSRWYQVLR
jgi:hypothetical protein